MDLLVDVGHLESRFSSFGYSVSVDAQVEARFGPFGDSANPDARLVHGLRRTYHRLGKCFGHTRWNS